METDESKKSPSLKVLLVEDSEHDRAAFHRALKKADGSYKIVEFVRAEEALATLSVNPSQFDILVTDYMLPGMNGLELCRELLKQRTTIPMVILTGTGSEQIAVEALKAGVDDYIVKDPGQGYLKLLPHVIRDAVQNHLNRQKRELAEAALQETLEQHGAILNSAMDGFWVVDPAGRFLEVNEAYCKMSGYAKHELLRMDISAVEDGESAADTAAHMRKVIAEGQDRFESRHRRKDGSVFDVEVSVQFRPSDEPKCVAFIRDITERKRGEEALKESEAKYRRLFEKSTNAIFIVEKSTGRYLDANKAAETLTGYSLSELKTLTTRQLTPEGAERRLERIAKGEESSDLGEVVYLCKDGTKRIVRLISVPLDGTSVYGIAHDITERKEAESVIKQNAENLRQMTDAMQETLSVIDLDGTFLYANQNAARNMTGGKSDGIIGKNIGDLIPKEQADSLIDRYRSVYQTGEPFHQETEVCLPKGATWFSNTLKLMDFGSPAVPAVLSVSLDITARRMMEANLQQAQKMESIGNLAGGIAHDFNNILFPIVGMSEMLMEDLPEGSVEYENAQEILYAGKRGADLVQQILAFSRQTDKKKMPVRIQQILKEAMKLSRSSIPANIKIKQNIQSDCNMVKADPTQIHQVVMNLITNAYHAVELNSGDIDVRLSEIEIGPEDTAAGNLLPDSYVLLSVSDTGTGIDDAIMDKIFEPYFTSKEQGKGTGLGLATVYGIVLEHNGDIKVYSELGKGTTFDVYLPTMRKVEISQSVERNEKAPAGHERILLVDDEEPVVNLEKQMLERMGYKVTYRLHSREALEAFRSSPHSFDLVVTDMSMPHMTGAQLAEAILSIRSDTPIVICTGFSERIDKNKAESIGVAAFLMKPIVRAELAKTVRKVLDEAKKDRELSIDN